MGLQDNKANSQISGSSGITRKPEEAIDGISSTSSSVNRGRSIKEMKNHLLGLLTSFRSNQFDSFGESKEFNQLLHVCHLQYDISRCAHTSGSTSHTNRDVIDDINLDELEEQQNKQRNLLVDKMNELSKTLTTMNTDDQ